VLHLVGKGNKPATMPLTLPVLRVLEACRGQRTCGHTSPASDDLCSTSVDSAQNGRTARTWCSEGAPIPPPAFEGRDPLVEYLREITKRTNGTFTLQDVFVSGCDDHVLAVQRFGATLDGEEQFFDVSSVKHFTGGRQKERWFHLHELNDFDAFIARF
jgi:hypothetical protein